MKSDLQVADNGFQITRVFEAPRPEVFGWWAEAHKLRQWSGCKEATSCEVDMDFRVGGSFTQKMQIAVDGHTCEVSFRGIYEELVIPEKISYRVDLGRAKARITFSFIDQGESTKVVLRQDEFSDALFCQANCQGTLESFDKLDAMLVAEPDPQRSNIVAEAR